MGNLIISYSTQRVATIVLGLMKVVYAWLPRSPLKITIYAMQAHGF